MQTPLTPQIFVLFSTNVLWTYSFATFQKILESDSFIIDYNSLRPLFRMPSQQAGSLIIYDIFKYRALHTCGPGTVSSSVTKMPLASPRPKKVGHEHPVKQATGISFDLNVYGKSLQTLAVYAKTASTGCQRAGWGWKNSDAHDTQLQQRKESSGSGCRLAKSSSGWALSLQHPLRN